MKRLQTQLLSISLCIPAAMVSCRHGGDKEQSSEASEVLASDGEVIRKEIAHPQSANEYATRIYVSTAPQQPTKEISECIELIKVTGRESANQDDMLKAVASSQPLFRQNLPLYHNCFYQIAARLDNRLAQGGPLVSELFREFFETTHALWIMAKALDRISGKQVYYSYLKQRYVQISRDVFGRQVEPLGDGFDEKKKPGGNIKQTNEKAAGRHRQ